MIEEKEPEPFSKKLRKNKAIIILAVLLLYSTMSPFINSQIDNKLTFDEVYKGEIEDMGSDTEAGAFGSRIKGSGIIKFKDGTMVKDVKVEMDKNIIKAGGIFYCGRYSKTETLPEFIQIGIFSFEDSIEENQIVCSDEIKETYEAKFNYVMVIFIILIVYFFIFKKKDSPRFPPFEGGLFGDEKKEKEKEHGK